MSKILALGDAHFRDNYSYCEKFEDRRVQERQDIEDAIVKATKPCDTIVILGDVFDSRQNSYRTVKNITSFIERFGDKRVLILAGNHSKAADGTSALDYLAEVSNKNWIFAINKVVNVDGLILIPYFYKKEWGVETNEEVVEKIMAEVPKKCVGIFLHHAIGKTKTESGQMTDLFNEPVLDGKELSKRAVRVIGGHIHLAQDNGNVHVAGSLMNADVGEVADKRVIRWDTETDKFESITLPGRKFAKLVNPTRAELEKIKDFNGLVRIITNKHIDIPEGFAEAVSIMEMPKENRKKAAMVDDFSMENLLKIYSKTKDLSYERLLEGYNLVRGN